MLNYMVHEAMRRDCFVQITQSLYRADSTQLECRDEFSKIHPFLNMLKQHFLNYFKQTHNLS